MSETFKGKPLSPGIAKGRLVFAFHVRSEGELPSEVGFVDEVRRFFKALGAAKKDLELMKARISKSRMQKEVFDVIDVYLMFIEDPTFADFVVEQIRAGKPAYVAIKEYFNDYADRLSSAGDPYLRERAKDIKYVKRFLLNKLFQTEIDWEEVSGRGEILVAPFVSPVDIVNVVEKGIKGIIVEKGSETSHASIVARSLGIPMVKLEDATERLKEGEVVLIDGSEGKVIVEPAEVYQEKPAVLEEVPEGKELPVEIYANIDFPEEAKILRELGAKGIGIFRTEYMFLVRRDWPSEQEQERYIKKLLRHTGDLLVNIRIADLGGDKVPVYAEGVRELLDYRGIRFFMLKEDLFRTHIRAILRAFAGKTLRLLIPMVSDAYEVRWVKEVVEEEIRSLDHPPDRVIYGAMIETPAGVLEIRRINQEVDFVSIGSNDLTSFMFGIDRECRLPEYLDPPNNMAIVESVKRIVKVCGADRVTLCGEVARSTKYLPYLLSSGLKKLSVNPAFIPELRSWLSEHLG